jgi:hypothetical protein
LFYRRKKNDGSNPCFFNSYGLCTFNMVMWPTFKILLVFLYYSVWLWIKLMSALMNVCRVLSWVSVWSIHYCIFTWPAMILLKSISYLLILLHGFETWSYERFVSSCLEKNPYMLWPCPISFEILKSHIWAHKLWLDFHFLFIIELFTFCAQPCHYSWSKKIKVVHPFNSLGGYNANTLFFLSTQIPLFPWVWTLLASMRSLIFFYEYLSSFILQLCSIQNSLVNWQIMSHFSLEYL